MVYRKKQSGFTLLEILVALSMIVLILAAVYGSYRATITSVARCKPKSIIEQQARLFLQRITSQLRCCYAGKLNQYEESLFENRAEKLVAQQVIQQEEPILFMSEPVSKGKTFLKFVTSADTLRPDRNIGGLAIVSYRLDESGTVLLRNIRRYVERFENNDIDYQWFPVLSNIKTISFEYLEAERWQEEWKSKGMKILPQAVRISLVLETDQTGPLSFISSAYVICRGFQIPAVTAQAAIAAH